MMCLAGFWLFEDSFVFMLLQGPGCKHSAFRLYVVEPQRANLAIGSSSYEVVLNRSTSSSIRNYIPLAKLHVCTA